MSAPAQIVCPSCGQEMARPDLLEGSFVRCPACGQSVQVAATSPCRPAPGKADEGASTPQGSGSSVNLGDPPVDSAPPASGSSWRSRGKFTQGETAGRIGRFQLLAALGRGAFGDVWRAYDPHLEREVALKVPRFDDASGKEAERFFREACAAAQLQHPHIVPVYDAGSSDGRFFIATKLIDGVPLSVWLQENKPLWSQACELVRRLAEALHYAHGAGIFHRDIKPSNIMMDRAGEPHLMDFGLARRSEQESTLTAEGSVLGTPAYMSPEQALGKGHQADARSDVYSLGALLYELLAGRKPFDGPAHAVLHQVIHEEPTPLRKLAPKMPRDLDAICMKCLAKEPQRRYGRAGALAEDLRRFLAGVPIQARPVGPMEKLGRWCQRRPAVAGLALGVALALLAGTGVASYFAVQANQRAEEAVREKDRADGNAERAIQEKDRAQENAEGALRERDRADENARQAIRERDRADENARLATRERDRADENAARARANLYAANMNMAQLAWENGQVGRVLDLLHLCRDPQPGQRDPRGWEWFYQERLCHDDLHTLKHTDQVHSIAFSPDGTRLASASEDGTVKIWDVARGLLLRTLSGHTGAVFGVAFNPDGTWLASAGRDNTVRLWEAEGGRELRTLPGPTDVVNGVAFSPDGKWLAAAGRDRLVWLWDLVGGLEPRSFKGHGVEIRSVAFSPDGTRLASSAYDVMIWDVATGRQLHKLERKVDGTPAVAFSPDGTCLASAGQDGSVQLWDVATRQDLRNVPAHRAGVLGLAFSSDGRLLASAGKDNTVRLWEMPSGRELYTFRGHTHNVKAVAFSPDGTRLASAARDVKVWNLSGGQGPRTFSGHTDGVSGLAFVLKGTRLASVSWDKTLKIWDVTTGHVLHSLRAEGEGVRAVASGLDGTLLASAHVDGTVKVRDAASGREVCSLTGHGDKVFSVAFSPDGNRLASASRDQTVRLWDVAGRRELRVFRGHTGDVWSVAFSPDGTRLASASEQDQTVRLWDVDSGKELLALDKNPARCVAFSPDGRLLAFASGSVIRVWDRAGSRQLLTLKGHVSWVSTIAFSPDSTRLVSAGDDRTVRVWDVASGQELHSLAGHTHFVWGVAFSPDGWQLASGSSDKSIKLRDARPLAKQMRTKKEALGLVEFLLSRPLPKADVIDQLRSHQALSDDVRSQALAFVDRFEEEQDPKRFAEASRALVRQRHLAPRWYRQALLQAETACRLAPDNGPYRTTLGMAQYRQAKYKDALATLQQSDKLNAGRSQAFHPADLAFLAMTEVHLGKKKEAAGYLKRLREAVKQPRWVNDEEARAFLYEAEATVIRTDPRPDK